MAGARRAEQLAPRNARYQATRGHTTIWVPDENIGWLSEFTLVLLDIATIDPASLALPVPKVSVEITQADASTGEAQTKGAAGRRHERRSRPVRTGEWGGAINPVEVPALPETAADGEGGDTGPLDKNQRIVESWENACREPSTGEIHVSRPPRYKDALTKIPIVVEASVPSPTTGIIPRASQPFSTTSSSVSSVR